MKCVRAKNRRGGGGAVKAPHGSHRVKGLLDLNLREDLWSVYTNGKQTHGVVMR